MSVTSSRPAEPQDRADRPSDRADRPAGPPSPGPSGHGIPVPFLIDVGLSVFGLAALVVMWLNPTWATIPYHLIFLSLILAYGFRAWSLPMTTVVLAGVVAVTGVLMVGDYAEGVIEWPELGEILLMPALLVAMVWHARRRLAAMESLEQMATLQHAMIERERQFFRDTSHAIRTPVTIARGHLELALSALSEPLVREDLVIAVRQLDRMSVLSNRLLALAQLDAGETIPVQRVDLATFVREVGSGWSADPTRAWVVECEEGGVVEADPAWLALGVDAIIENAVHFTEPNGRIEIRGQVGSRTCSIVVSDDGTGIPPDELEQVFERFWHKRPPNGPMGSGLGLAMARATARAWGGHVHATNNPGGGASFALVLPRASQSRGV